MTIRETLEQYRDDSSRDFSAKIVPNVDKSKILGIKVPFLRKLAKEIFKNNQYESFLNELPHKYFEENLLHGFIIQQIKNYDLALIETKRFLPYVDNWAVSDTFAPKVFKKNLDKLISEIKIWLKSNDTYIIRFGTTCLMDFYLDDAFKEEYLNLLIPINSDEYYINMAIAWYYATALAKQYEPTIKIIENKLLSRWIHNKTIQKANESYRVTDEHKQYLKSLKY